MANTASIVKIELLLPEKALVTEQITRELEETASDVERANYFDSFQYDDYQLEDVSAASGLAD